LPDRHAKPPAPVGRKPEIIRGFNKILDFRIAEWREGYARVEVELAEHHLNRSGLVHGGVLAALLDAACGYPGVLPGPDGLTRRAVTLSMTTSFIGQAKSGTLSCAAERRGGGKTVFMATGEVRDAEGRLLAIGEAVYRYISSTDRPAG